MRSRRGTARFDAARYFTNPEKLIAPRVEKFMDNLHLAMNYRWNGAIIVGISRYLECGKIANALSPHHDEEKVFVLFHYIFSCVIQLLRCALAII